ncbi:hypothetical protein Tco_0316225, partial [Tanacetum coccineum]
GEIHHGLVGVQGLTKRLKPIARVLQLDGIDLKFSKGDMPWFTVTPIERTKKRRNRLFRLEKNQNCLVRDRIVNGLWAWDWRRPVNGGRALANLNKLLMDIGSLNVEVDRDCVVSSLSTDGSY